MLYFHVRVALLKCDFLRVPCTESWTSWAQLKAENLRNPKMVLHVPIAAPKLELLASKPNRAFFLGHPVKTSHFIPYEVDFLPFSIHLLHILFVLKVGSSPHIEGYTLYCFCSSHQLYLSLLICTPTLLREYFCQR